MIFKWMLTALLALVLLALQGCSTAQLSKGGALVEVVNDTPKNCKNLGPVFGKGGGSFGGGLISDESLMEYASNDIRNKAASKGATHVVVKSHQMGQTSGEYGGTTSTSTMSGVAFKCTVKKAE